MKTPKEVLKFEIFAPLTVFKTPFSVKGFETFPLPPYSTMIGLLYTALGRKYNEEKFSLSVQGDYEVLFRDYLTFRKYNRKDKEIGKKPLEVPFLFNFKLACHILGDGETLNLFEDALKQPKTYLGLGIREIPVKVRKVKKLKAVWKTLEEPQRLKYNAFIPINLAEHLGFYEPKGRYSELAGIEFLVPSFIKTEKPYRDYHFEEVFYVPKGAEMEEDSEVLIDEEGDFIFPTEER